MKTKRMKKLLMGMGLSRNQVNRMVQTQRTEGSKKASNELYYRMAKRGVQSLEPELLPFLTSIVLADREECEDTKRPACAGNTDEPKGDGFTTPHHPEG